MTKLIVALGNTDHLSLVDMLGDRVEYYKVGWEITMQGELFPAIEQLYHQGKKVFLDLKMRDIPSVIDSAVGNTFWSVEVEEAVHMMTFSSHYQLPKFVPDHVIKIAVPGLTTDLVDTGWLANCYRIAMNNRFDGVVVPPVKGFVRAVAGNDRFFKMPHPPVVVVPGIRPEGYRNFGDDHPQTMTPRQAVIEDADYIVVGRPIVFAKDKIAAVDQILEEMR